MPLPATPEAATQLAAPVLLVLTGAGMFIGAMVRGWSSGGKERDKEEAKAAEPQNIALAGALIDSSSAKQLSRALIDATEQMERGDRAQGDRARDLLDHMDRNGRDMRRMCEGLDSLERVMTRSAEQSAENVRTLKLLVEGLPTALARARRNDEIVRSTGDPVPTPADDPIIPGRMRRGEV